VWDKLNLRTVRKQQSAGARQQQAAPACGQVHGGLALARMHLAPTSRGASSWTAHPPHMTRGCCMARPPNSTALTMLSLAYQTGPTMYGQPHMGLHTPPLAMNAQDHALPDLHKFQQASSTARARHPTCPGHAPGL